MPRTRRTPTIDPRSLPSTATELRDLRRQLVDELTDIDSRHTGALPDDVQARWDEAEATVRAIDDVLTRHQRVADLVDNPGNRQTLDLDRFNVNHIDDRRPWEAARSALPRDLRSIAETAIERSPVLEDDEREKATHIVTHARQLGDGPGEKAARWAIVTSDPAYLRAWTSLMADPQRGHLGWDDATRAAFNEAEAVKRAMTSGTGSSGGYMVPTPIDPAIILTSAGTLNDIRTIARKVTLVEGNTWRGVSSAGVSAEWKAEGAEVADGTPTLAQPAIPVHLADVFVPYSIEAEQDDVGLLRELVKVCADAKDVHEATAFTNGNGTGKPTGVIYSVTAVGGSEVAPTTAETFALDDVDKVAMALPARHHARATWLANHTSYISIRKLARALDSAEGLWQDLGAGAPPTLLGYPTARSSDMDAIADIDAAATATNDVLLLGDFDNYVVVDRLGATTEVVPHLFHADNQRPTAQRGLIYYWRVGADVVNDDAFRLLAIPTAA